MANNPKRFGPRLWPWVHLSARRLDFLVAYDAHRQTEHDPGSYAEHRRALRQFLADLPYFIPCEKCGDRVLEFLQKHPLPVDDGNLDDPQRFWKWSVDLHNFSNQHTGQRTFSLEEADASFRKQWLDQSDDKDLADAFLARRDDAARVMALEAEVASLRTEQVRNVTTQVTVMAVGGVLGLGLIVAVIVLLRRR